MSKNDLDPLEREERPFYVKFIMWSGFAVFFGLFLMEAANLLKRLL